MSIDPTFIPNELVQLAGALERLHLAIGSLASTLDLPGRLAAFIRDNLEMLRPMLTSYLQRTAAMPDGGAFVSDHAIRRFAPITTGVADAALVLVVGFAFFRVMWAHGTYSQFTARTMLPRLLMAGFLINFAVPLFQAAVDGSNALATTAVAPIGDLPWLHLVEPDGSSIFDFNVGPGLVVSALLFAGFGLLSIAYVVRYALLVILAILAPLAALLTVLPETQSHAREWASLMVSTLLMQPLQLLILAIGCSIEVDRNLPLRHLLALAALWICFKVPGALHSASSVGSHAGMTLRGHAHRAVATASKAFMKVAI